MVNKFWFLKDAEQEFNHAIEYYEDCEQGLGLRFSKEVFETIYRIRKFPFTWEKIDYATRRCLTNKFPFGILYQISDRGIIIVAVMNLHRFPDYWKKRKTEG